MITLSKRVQQVAPSATLAMKTKAEALTRAGTRIINLATGEPDFDTPEHIKKAAKDALDRGMTKYVDVGGIAELKSAICKKLKRDHDLIYTPEEIVVTVGAKDAIFTALMATIDEGDEVLVPAPYWVSYPEQIKIVGGVPKIIETHEKNSFRLDPDTLSKAIASKTKALILNSPSNPTGSAYPSHELKIITDVAVSRGLIIISDEIYEKLVYDNFIHVSPASFSAEAKAHTIVINGVSKAYAMTGWRMGYAAGPKHVIAKMKVLQGQQTSSIPSFIQPACVVAMNGPQEEVAKMTREFQTRRNIMHRLLLSIANIRVHMPEGAFYHFPNVKAFLGKKGPEGEIKTSEMLAQYLLGEAHVATVAGDSFGAPGYLRISYAASREDIEAGIANIKKALEKLK